MAHILPAAATYYIVYGFSEGSRHGKHLHRALQAAGFQPSGRLETADVIIAHSGGTLLLPKPLKPRLLLVCQPPAGYTVTGWRVMLSKVQLDVREHARRHQLRLWFWKSGLNIVYGVKHSKRNRQIVRQVERYRRNLPTFDADRTILLISRLDPLSNSLSMQQVKGMVMVGVGLPGAHDDLWTNPQEFIRILQSLL